MKLEYVDEFFRNKFKAVYLQMGSRRRVHLVRHDNTRTGMSYARYLMTVYLNRKLDRTEHVDHIDNNPLNDVISNLQILTQAENNRKKNEHLGIKVTYITLVCPNCKMSFTKEGRQLRHKLKQGKQPCCSRACGYKYGHTQRITHP